jgi:hypothetical protein
MSPITAVKNHIQFRKPVYTTHKKVKFEEHVQHITHPHICKPVYTTHKNVKFEEHVQHAAHPHMSYAHRPMACPIRMSNR